MPSKSISFCTPVSSVVRVSSQLAYEVCYTAQLILFPSKRGCSCRVRCLRFGTSGGHSDRPRASLMLEIPLAWCGGFVAEVQVGKATRVYLYVVWGDRALGLTLLNEVKCIYLSPCFHERGLLRTVTAYEVS